MRSSWFQGSPAYSDSLVSPSLAAREGVDGFYSESVHVKRSRISSVLPDPAAQTHASCPMRPPLAAAAADEAAWAAGLPGAHDEAATSTHTWMVCSFHGSALGVAAYDKLTNQVGGWPLLAVRSEVTPRPHPQRSNGEIELRPRLPWPPPGHAACRSKCYR
jgi:hypothetical protein